MLCCMFSNSLSCDVSSIVLVTNLKHSTIWVDRRKLTLSQPDPVQLLSIELAVVELWSLCPQTVNPGFSATVWLCSAWTLLLKGMHLLCVGTCQSDWPLGVHPSSVFQIKKSIIKILCLISTNLDWFLDFGTIHGLRVESFSCSSY